jgi:hypothetical protein
MLVNIVLVANAAEHHIVNLPKYGTYNTVIAKNQ